MSSRKSVRFLAAAIAVVALSSSAFAQTDAGAPKPVKQQLTELIDRAGKVPEQEYTYQSWNDMRFAMNDARRIAGAKDASDADLSTALAALSKATDALQRRPVVQSDAPKIGLSATLFATSREGLVDNVALQWATSEKWDRYEVQRATSADGPFATVYTGTGRSFSDPHVGPGTHFYRLVAHRGDESLASHLASVSTIELPSTVKHFSNQAENDGTLPWKPLKVRDTFYDFTVERDGPALKQVMMRTSADGKTWTDAGVVMDRNSFPDLADFKFEAITRFYDEVNDQFVWWCHYEKSGPHYGEGKAFVATAKPGQPFTVHRNFRPFGVEVRDMSIYIDTDKTGYLVAASNVPGQGANATLYIFKLNKTYTDTTEIVAKLAENGYREAPHIVKKDGIYYLFYSQAAGWYPSRGGYASATSVAGPWSSLRSIGNTSTFAAQSGGVIEFGPESNRSRIMAANRWLRGDGTSRNSALPIALADGFAFYDYAPTLLHDAATGTLVPLQSGQLLSQDKPAESSIAAKPGNEAAKAFDGDYETAFQSDDKKWPFTLTTDLGSACEVRNVQVSWSMHKGSEAYYTYTIDGSLDGQSWTTLVDKRDESDTRVSKTYGFTSDLLPEGTKARFVRLNVINAKLHNNPNNWYPPAVYEVKVFGAASAK
jgi:hypothetical protein